MEALAGFVLGLGMMAAAQDAAYRAGHAYYYYTAPTVRAESGYRPAVVYAPVPGPQVVYVPRTDAALTYTPASPARSAESTDQFIRHWQGFMEPAPQR